MEVNPRTPQQIFGLMIRYLIPPFQRSYVWNQEDQWQPLWNDVARTAEAVLDALDHDADAQKVEKHFFGAVVVQDAVTPVGHVQRKNVIDGQQRLTTLQLLTDAVQEVVAEHGTKLDAKGLTGLILNDPDAVPAKEEQFKVWPSRRDRAAFEAVMTNGIEVPAELADTRIVQAHRFFRKEALEWATAGEAPEDVVARRLSALATVLDRHLQVVAIDLEMADNEQLIFETLNARGTQLLATDLVKNYVFRAVDDADGPVDEWERRYWSDFDEDWWHEEISQGRYNRPRLDMFLQYWLIMRTHDEVPNDKLFKLFRKHADDNGVRELEGAQALLAMLKSDASQFRGLAEFHPQSPEGTFYYRVVESLELGAFTPVMLWLLADRHAVPAEQRAKALASLESWAVRRMLLRLTTKDINRLVISLVRELSAHDPAGAGDVTEEFLAGQQAPTRYWPRDEEVIESATSARLYGMVKQGRIRVVLEAIEDWKRSPKSEIQHCPRRHLQIEHVMPQAWQDHWGADITGDPEAGRERDRIVQTLGNLTLVTDKLNPALGNLPWTDEEATTIRPDAIGKHTQLDQHSMLLLNRELTRGHPTRWREEDVIQRGIDLASIVLAIWPRPVS
ncbi:DUF262 domain-containing protein [Amycolatopsis anabasis]|uniref:DUF262 domain-containing protein n=1 Tax=Amycolatopsis anabasis TaxID=1840409 RepID=UPI00131BE9CB|nr:DUF262 domain-containing protein [Amycolatopsis anabasis]